MIKRSDLLLAATIGCLLTPSTAFAQAETREPVKIFFGGTADSDFINAVYGEVLKEYGYRVKYVQSDFAAHFAAVVNGDIDISLGAFQTVPEMSQNAFATGKVENYGPTGVKVTEGWWYSNAFAQACPGLPNWEALKQPECIAALVTPDTAPKGRFVDAPADWGVGSAEFVEENDLDLVVVNSGSPASLVATLQGALARDEPILAWAYEPHWVLNSNDGNYIDRPGFKRDNDVLKIGNIEANAKIPNAIAILRAFSISAEEVRVGMDRVDNGGIPVEEAAHEWMDANESTWRSWLP